MATITGSAGNDNLFGSADSDLLLGLGGDDTLNASAGNDTLDGGGGFDVADYGFETTALLADLGQGRVRIGSKTDSLIAIDALYGGKADDTLIGNLLVRETLDGGHGNDTLTGQDGDVLLGSSGNDRFEADSRSVGSPQVDYGRLNGPLRIDLGAGLVTGTGKRDVLVNIRAASGSLGDDEIIAAAPAGVPLSGSTLAGAAGSDSLRGGTGNDWLYGGEGNDLLLGAAGNDLLWGGDGDDTLDGGEGNDYVSFSDAKGPVRADLTTGRASGAGEDVLRNVERLAGSTFDDLLRGDAGPNELGGGGGNDTLEGLDGDDVLAVSGGRSVLRGGPGDDILRFGGGDGSTLDGGAGSDTVVLLSQDPGDATVFDLATGVWTQAGRSTSATRVQQFGPPELSLIPFESTT